MGKKKAIDGEQVFKLAKLMCTQQEMASFFDVSVDTLDRRFAEEMHKGWERGKLRLRRAQLRAALKGNVAMQIWLGKQYLGQAEKVEVKSDDLMSQHISIINITKPNGELKKYNKFYQRAHLAQKDK